MSSKKQVPVPKAIDPSTRSGIEAIFGPNASEVLREEDQTPRPPKQQKPEPQIGKKTAGKDEAGVPSVKSGKEPGEGKLYKASINIKYSEEMRNKLWIIRAAERKSIGKLTMDAIQEYIRQFEEKHGEIVIPDIGIPKDEE